MSYLVLNRQNRNAVNKKLPYFQIFYSQNPATLKASILKNKNFPNETNIFVANTPVTDQMIPFPQTFQGKMIQ